MFLGNRESTAEKNRKKREQLQRDAAFNHANAQFVARCVVQDCNSGHQLVLVG